MPARRGVVGIHANGNSKMTSHGFAAGAAKGFPFTVTFFSTRFSVWPGTKASSVSFTSMFSSVISRSVSPGLPRSVPNVR